MYCRGGESNDICMMGTSVNIRNLRRLSATLALRLSTCAVALGLALPMQCVMALGTDTVFISGNAGLSYDSNLFRLDSGVNPSGATQQDSFIYHYGLGLSADVPYSRQRFRANLNIQQNIYASFHDLNYVGGSGSAAWLWQVGDDLNGDLGVSVAQSLQNYSYTSVSTQRNVVRNTNVYFDPRYRIAPNFELQGGLNYTNGRNTLEAADVNDFNTLSARLGLAYVTYSGNHVGLQVQTWKTEFPNQAVAANNDYRDNRVSIFFNWAVTGASQIEGSVGYKQRQHDLVPQRDFDGWTGTVGWNWTPTGRTHMRLFLGRDLGGVEDLVITYARTYTVSFNPSYQLTSKMTLNGTAQYQDLRFFGNTGFVNTSSVSGTLADRHDKISTLGLGLGYSITRIFSMGLNYTYSHRNSNVPLGNYNDNVVSFNGSVTF